MQLYQGGICSFCEFWVLVSKNNLFFSFSKKKIIFRENATEMLEKMLA